MDGGDFEFLIWCGFDWVIEIVFIVRVIYDVVENEMVWDVVLCSLCEDVYVDL